ncbi:hypothetical protein QK289_04755 [Exiguobacterium antarcticum]|uniref:TSPY-like 2 n=1 Tax=Exiguobacterium antarcticum TaxID=132920 RepID=A0ABT6R0D0_9BACL|nr:hypothetical protein [Exiguobacterium antarcticum]MDI3234310.1 hypothetical protein [Exiguobacterium antarcticum]
MADQHEKETDPITSGNKMTKDDIAGRDQSDTASQEKSDSQTDEASNQASDQKTSDQPDSSTSDEAPDLSHEADEDGDVTPSDADNQEK